MLYESIALPLSYVGLAPTKYSNRLSGGLQAELGGVAGGVVGAGSADAVISLAVVTKQLVGGRIGATTESALPVHDALSKRRARRERGLERG